MDRRLIVGEAVKLIGGNERTRRLVGVVLGVWEHSENAVFVYVMLNTSSIVLIGIEGVEVLP